MAGLAQPSHIPSGATPTGKGLKIHATGVVKSAADMLKIGPLRDISDMLQGFADMYITKGKIQQEYEELQQQLQALLKIIEENCDGDDGLTIIPKVNDIREFIEGELNSLGNKQGGKQHGRLLEGSNNEERIITCCRRIQSYINQLSLDTSLSVLKMKEAQSKDRMSALIGRLLPSLSAWYNSNAGEDLKRRECTPGTRVDVLANLLGWANSNSVDTVYWLNGMAGTGKTTIAYSVCKELANKRKLSASFFCSRLRQECRDVKMIIPSIAYQLAQASPPFRSALSVVLEEDQDVHHKVLDVQFEVLIREPLLVNLASGPLIPGQMVVVIDALDECDNKESTRRILNILLSKTANLPIKFIVSSRPEPQIRDQMSEKNMISRLVLHELDTGKVQTDIERYFREELEPMIPPPNEEEITVLARKAGVLFIYAATVVRYISYDNFGRNPAARLRTILNASQIQGSTKSEEIDQLYATVLGAALGDQGIEREEREDMQQVLCAVICAREPLTIGALSELLEMKDEKRIYAALRPLWSVLHVVESNALVTTLHASFPDFMFDPMRSKEYYCDQNSQHKRIARLCFKCINQTQPHFNICKLETSYLLDEKVPELEEQVNRAIPLQLFYACRYWAEHMEEGNCVLGGIGDLRDFLSKRLLLWLEVLNLKKSIEAARECMRLLEGWCKLIAGEQELVELADDAKRFVDAFASNPIHQSTPHIYVSMLAFWPRSAPIAKHYAEFTRGPVEPEGTAMERRQRAHLATWAFDNAVDPMTLSPDGFCIALGIDDGVLVVDSSNGRVVLGPLACPEGRKTIAFSSDGSCILSGSFKYRHPHENATIVGWDTHTGNTVLGPYRIQSRDMRCLSFSPDCTCIATGCSYAVSLWDAKEGSILHYLATSNIVTALTFSPNGTRVAASCATIFQIWDTHTGNAILKLDSPGDLRYNLRSITYSPDDRHIIGVSNFHIDEYQHIYILDSQTGDQHSSPIDSATSGIHCIGCSPDSRYIVSGSQDQTVHVWDAQNGNMVLGPLKAHSQEITSVMFSFDGSHIISACEGGLICKWDARKHIIIPSSVEDSCGWIRCVKFSSDGTRFASGSEDGRICIWDADTGDMLVGPVEAHTTQITALDFLGHRVVSGSADGEIHIFDARNREVTLGPFRVDSRSIQAIAYSLDGELLATGSEQQGRTRCTFAMLEVPINEHYRALNLRLVTGR
ncbi:Vegetative incompatibility protein HET-E-1 [Podospora anserina] [Rhizoctonia solani]|uniref:Vegetative incompatibility protein HET-E-1 [Podospora anserina] n=1 Tax=Rhizoctonia solani TaxID=456999 RepID=A0A0K6FN55_9AGAM|nr:Vegetative incompatibility protein HET-E-1 [Podospora anserina] [Rhizoctonia solani]